MPAQQTQQKILYIHLEIYHFKINSLNGNYNSTGMWRSVVWLKLINDFDEYA